MFIIAYHLAERQIFVKYIKRLLPFAIISIFVDYFYYYPKFPYLNIMFTFIVSIAMLYGFERSSEIKNKALKYTFCIYIALLGSFLGLFLEFDTAGVWIIPTMYWYIKKPSLPLLILPILLISLDVKNLSYFLLISTCSFLLMQIKPVPSKHRSSFKKTGWMFYAYYPFHKSIIAFLNWNL